MTWRRPSFVASCLLSLALLAACGGRDNRNSPPRTDAGTSDSGRVDGATVDSGPIDPRCAPSPYTGHACSADDTGASCTGGVSCACGFDPGDFMSFPTACECRSGDLGQVYYCEDDCESLCASVGDAGTADAGAADSGAGRDSGTGSPCQVYCDLAAAEGCPITDCVASCEEPHPDCDAELDAFVRCVPTGPVACMGGALFPEEGCEEEINAVTACTSM